MKKPLKKTLISVGLIITLIVLSLIGLAFIVDSSATRDPNISFASLEDLQAVLTDDYYFFDFDEQIMQAGSYSATANTKSARRFRQGDFEYIGYSIYYVEAPFPEDSYKAPTLYVSAVSGKNLDGLTDERRRNFDSNLIEELITIDSIECIFIYGPRTADQLYFMIENIRYCFKGQTSINNEEKRTLFLSLCESAITSRYPNI